MADRDEGKDGARRFAWREIHAAFSAREKGLATGFGLGLAAFLAGTTLLFVLLSPPDAAALARGGTGLTGRLVFWGLQWPLMMLGGIAYYTMVHFACQMALEFWNYWFRR
jgi:hypothetical protein